MTVSSSVNKVTYSGNSATTVFPVNYYFLENSHLQVILVSNNVETIQTLTSQYTVTGAGNPSGGSVTMLTPPANGTQLIIVRNVPATQETDYLANDPFPAESHERALDKLTMLVQQNTTEIDRALKIPLSSLATASTEMPTPVANKLLAWNSNATAITNFDPAAIVNIVGQQASFSNVFAADGVETNFTLDRSPGNANAVDVSVQGATQKPNIDYVLNGSVLTFTTPPPAFTNILARYSEVFAEPAVDAINVRYTPAGTGAVLTNAEAVLRRSVNVDNFGATGDGATDDTQEFILALNHLQSVGGGVLELTPNKNYALLTWTAYVTTAPIQIKGNGAKITGPVSGTGLFLKPSGTFVVENVAFARWGTVFVRLLADLLSIVDARIENNVFTTTNTAIDFECPCENLNIIGNTITGGAGQIGIRIGTNDKTLETGWTGIRISNNTITDRTTTGTTGNYPILCYAQHSVIDGNIIRNIRSANAECFGIYVKTRFSTISNNVVEDVRSTGSSGDFADCVGITIKGDTRVGVSVSPGGYKNTCVGNTVKNIGVQASHGAGIKTQTEENTIGNNIIEDVGSTGIDANDFGAVGSIITGNSIKGINVLGTYGIWVQGVSDGVIVDSNQIIDYVSAVRLDGGTDPSTVGNISNNFIKSTVTNARAVRFASGTVRECSISNNIVDLSGSGSVVIATDSSNHVNVTVQNNNFTICGTAGFALFSGTFGAGLRVVNNRGYKSQSGGVSSVTTSPLVVNHGMYTTPQGVVATMFNNTTAIVTAYDFTPTQFTLAHTAGTTQSVMWNAWVADANA